MPVASSPTEDFHRQLIAAPVFPPYIGIPDAGRWNGDVVSAMNRLQNTRHLIQTARYQSGIKTGMQGQRMRLLAGGGPVGLPGRIAGQLTDHVFVGQAIERYWAGTQSVGEPSSDPVSQAIHGSLLAGIYTVTGRFMRDISRNVKLRTDNDCALFPLYRAVHFAAAAVFGDVYGINGDEIDTYLKSQLIGLVEHGAKVDGSIKKKDLVYLSDQQALAYRLHIKDGSFWIVNGAGVLELFDCSGETFKTKGGNSACLGNERNDGKGVAGFAMGYNRDIYANSHKNKGGEQGYFFHSAYMAGREVLCTGCITVVAGKLTYINNASGHYRPNEQQLSLALQALLAIGVDISQVTVECLNPQPGQIEFFAPQSATEFLKDQQGAGFTEGRLNPAKRIREALEVYERRASGFWSSPSAESRQALVNLKLIKDDKTLFAEVKYLLRLSEKSPNYTAERSRLKADGELAKQLKRAIS